MTGVERPVFLIALRDSWLTSPAAYGVRAALAFGTQHEADAWALDDAHREGLPVALYRIVEFRCAGVSEAS